LTAPNSSPLFLYITFMKTNRIKAFKVGSVSSNTNSFGLYGMILVGRDGEAWQVGANSINVRRKGTVLGISVVGRHGRDFAHCGFEIPEKLPTAPPGVVDEVWA